MREFILGNVEAIVAFGTAIITYGLGKLAKKYKKVASYNIPLQNILIAVLSGFLYYVGTGDFSLLVAAGSPIATLLYDFAHSIEKKTEPILTNEENNEEEE